MAEAPDEGSQRDPREGRGEPSEARPGEGSKMDRERELDSLFPAFWECCEKRGTRAALGALLSAAEGSRQAILEALEDAAAAGDHWGDDEPDPDYEPWPEDAGSLEGYEAARDASAILGAACTMVDLVTPEGRQERVQRTPSQRVWDDARRAIQGHPDNPDLWFRAIRNSARVK